MDGRGVPAAIEFDGVVKDYARTRALAGIDLRVPVGATFGFLGPNGAGKTTAIRLLLDLLRPTSGQARVLGLDCRADALALRPRIGYVPGDLRLYEPMRVGELLDFIDHLRGRRADAHRSQLLARLDVDPGRRIGALSKGNRQKVGLVQALMHRPDVLVLDEPTSGLDPLMQEEVAHLLAESASAGATVFFSSHALQEVERTCSAVAMIRAGRIVAVEEVAALKARAVRTLEVTFASPPPDRLFEGIAADVIERDGVRVRMRVSGAMDAALKAIASVAVVDLRTQEPSLEEIFVGYYAAEDARPAREEVVA
ncbi:MAG: ABC transporter ATP-binding protein [Dehalococcoidia bacterium]|nr:ABC transporter ATP-binding protein [Dehalococcoidia bacterium]